MTLSLGGIIFIQSLWIQHAMNMEASRFDKSVQEALLESVESWQRFDRFSFIDKKINLPPPPPPKQNRPERAKRPDRAKTHKSLIISDTASAKIMQYQFDYDVQWTPDSIMETEIRLQTDNNKSVFMVARKVDSLRVFMDEMQVRAEMEKARLIEEKLDEFNENMEEWVVEYSFDINKMLTKLPTKKLDTLIKNELKARGITIPFNYQVEQKFDDTTEIILPSGSQDFNIQDTYETELFPDNFFGNNIYLRVSFPEKKNFLYQSIILLIAGSILFTLIMLTTFWLTLYFMVKQKKVSRIKTDFINNMTHEFKTPIATIGLASDALLSPKVFGIEEPTRYYLDVIKQENKRMNSQVEKVLQMALIEKGSLQFDNEWVDAHQIIEHTADMMQIAAQQKSGRITTVLRANCSVLLTDEIHFTNLMNNLLDNAIKYCENNPEIVIETFNQQENLIIRVADNGVGMSKEVMRHIFDQFYRKPTGNIHNVKGFGLGLSYVRAVVNAMNGNIRVESEPGHGSVFTLTFKCHKNE